MAVCVNLFHASTRAAMTGNFRGTPSSGKASRLATRTAPLAADFLRKGSRNTAKPAPKGIKPRITLMIPASTCLKKPRRSAGFAGRLPIFIKLESQNNKKCSRQAQHYDAGYLAVAKAKGLALWTRDNALTNKAPPGDCVAKFEARRGDRP